MIEKKLEYSYDAEGRARATTTKVGIASTTTISHYDGPGAAVAWTEEERRS